MFYGFVSPVKLIQDSFQSKQIFTEEMFIALVTKITYSTIQIAHMFFSLSKWSIDIE